MYVAIVETSFVQVCRISYG